MPKGVAGVAEVVTASAEVNKVENLDYKGARREQDEMFYEPQNLTEYTAWERLKIERDDSNSERDLREKHAGKSHRFSLAWASFIAVLILLKGFGKCLKFELTTTEFLTVIGALSGTILAYYTFVVSYLFKRCTNNDKKEK